MRRPIICANWKMNKIISEAIEFTNGLKRTFYEQDNIDIVICPSFVTLSEVRDIILDSNIFLGAQNLYFEDRGAFTGEVSALQLKDVGCKFVIIGHSERRQYFFETDEMINRKTKTALRIGLSPILCVGENLEEREENLTLDILERQIEECLKDIKEDNILNLVIAYEPIWAIGTGKNATPQQAEEAQQFIRHLLAKIYNKDIAENIRIQYGGSVTSENISELITQPNIDGVLVGGASLNLDSFIQIVKRCMVF